MVAAGRGVWGTGRFPTAKAAPREGRESQDAKRPDKQAAEKLAWAARKRLGGQMLGAATTEGWAPFLGAATTQMAPKPLRPPGCRGTAPPAALPLLDDVQGIDGVATPCIRGRGAGNATHGSFSAAC